ncbi:MAG: GGDEF domain-containing protein [Lachnospiraceae bacterium]|nr:GGDEF domain-containing protein [Lachnospiraceae bacterium]
MAVDFITGLPDFNEYVQICSEHLENNSKGNFVVVINDVSNFKFINKFYSHETGNLFIREMAKFFYSNNPHVVCACRIDSEQFSALLDIGRASQAAELNHIAIMNAQFEQLMSAKYPDIFIHVYTGVHFLENTKEEFRLAYDKAKMSKSKIKGQLDKSYNVYNPDDYEISENIMESMSLFNRAKENDRIVAFLQPKFSVSQDKVVGAEVLARIEEIDGSIIPPGRFIPALEQTGIIGVLDSIMINKCFGIIKKWQEEGKELIPISVNVSRQVFIKPDFVDSMKQLLKEYKIPAEYIDFEILESMFVENMDLIVNTTNALREAGFKVSMDDFGSGYSSLNQIAYIPADTIKLDNMFARKSLGTDKGRHVVKSVIEMLHGIDYHIVFEGIETAEQRDLVSGYGCDVIQGYFYSKPIPVKEFEENYQK